MRLTIIAIARHRNGVGGAPFEAVLFEDDGPAGNRKVGILFEQEGHCSVLDVARLAAGDVAFGSNSWRGDRYEPHLRNALRTSSAPPDKEPAMTSDATVRGRAGRCRQALTDYSDDDRFVCLIDLLADAMHWCDANGEDFHYALAVAGKHYVNELDDEQTDERRVP